MLQVRGKAGTEPRNFVCSNPGFSHYYIASTQDNRESGSFWDELKKSFLRIYFSGISFLFPTATPRPLLPHPLVQRLVNQSSEVLASQPSCHSSTLIALSSLYLMMSKFMGFIPAHGSFPLSSSIFSFPSRARVNFAVYFLDSDTSSQVWALSPS